MDAYIFQSDILCKDCGENIKKVLPPPSNYIFDDESSYDSDQWPKGPFGNGGGEADTPQHCGNCGLFLENPLTEDGEKYVIQKYLEYREFKKRDGLVTAETYDKNPIYKSPLWVNFYILKS